MADDREERKAQARRQFNMVAPDYDTGPGCFAHFGRRLVEAADVRPGHRVLDVASGRGAVLFPAAERAGPAGEAVGIDLAEEMVRAVNAEAERRGIKARVRVGDAESPDFPDAFFDRVLCGFGIMFFPDQGRALSEFRRVLKPGGILAVSTWRIDQNWEIGAVLDDTGLGQPRQPGWISEPDALSRLLTQAGFSDVRVAADTRSFRYSGPDEYWQQARGTGMRGALDGLDASQTERVRRGLAERFDRNRTPDGIYSEATALIAVAAR